VSARNVRKQLNNISVCVLFYRVDMFVDVIRLPHDDNNLII
jgi:hypothetical protein